MPGVQENKKEEICVHCSSIISQLAVKKGLNIASSVSKGMSKVQEMQAD
jgi:hypothetical protein